MKTLIAGCVLAMLLAVCAHAGDTNALAGFEMPPGMAGCFETERAQVLKVFSAEDNGAHFRAYQVKWKNQDVIVSDMFGTTNFNEGDTITFMAQNIEVPAGDKKLKMLQFMIMDTSAFAPKEEGVEPAH